VLAKLIRVRGISSRSHHAQERGTALILIPAIALIVILAAALVIDSAIGFTAKRDLNEAVAAAANDAANALAEDSVFGSGVIRVDRAEAERLATAALRARMESVVVTQVDGQPVVDIVVSGTADRLFGAVVGAEAQWNLTTRARGTAHEN
jgi:Flp pilus assembly protein TadG